MSDLMEVTAGGRKIATARGRLPWEVPRQVQSRGAALQSRGAPRLDTAHEDPQDLPDARGPAVGSTGSGMRSGMRIEVPASTGANGSGPLSAPPAVGVGYYSGGNVTPVDDEYGDGGHTPKSPQEQRHLSGQDKVSLWLPSGSSTAVDVSSDSFSSASSVGRPGSSRRGRPTCGMGGMGGVGDPPSPTMEMGGGPRESLKLLKRRQGPQCG